MVDCEEKEEEEQAEEDRLRFLQWRRECEKELLSPACLFPMFFLTVL